MLLYLLDKVLDGEMNTRNKNILTAVILIAVATTIYVFAVMRAISQ